MPLTSKNGEPAETFERIGPAVELCVNRSHRFGTDAFLLSDFARPRAKDAVCDLCSGCGVVAALWFRDPPGGPRIAYCVEIQREAVRLMERTVRRSGLDGRMRPIHADLRRLDDIFPAGTMDLATCNPPYQAEGTGLTSETSAALLARHETACTFADVCRAARRLLRSGGRLCICLRPHRMADAFAAMRAQHIEPKRLRTVQKRADTAPWLALIEGRKDGRPFLQVEPPLLIQDGRGNMSAELRRIYHLKEESAHE